tara:strand:- start:228 stop:1724 length:1497 start_codon:yes stop_codon:yes gene_type:complete
MAANNLQINVNVGGNALAQLQQVQSQIRKTDTVVGKSARGYNAFGAAADKSTTKVRRFGQAGVQQVGFQLGDLAVQLQNGTHFLTAFGQQGSQLLGIFGATGAILGAVVAGAAALGTVFLKMRDTAGSLTEELDGLEESLQTLDGFAISNQQRFDKLTETYGKATTQVNKLFESQKALAEFELQNSLRKTIEALQTELDIVDDLARAQEKAAQAQTGRTNERIQAERALRGAIQRTAAEFDLSNQQAIALGESFQRLKTLDPFSQATQSAAEVQKIFDILSTKSFEEMSVAEREAANNLLRFAAQLNEVSHTVSETATGAVNAIGLTTGEAKNLADGMAGAFGNSFKGIVQGTMSVKDAFRNMAQSIISQLLDVLVVQRLVSGISTGLQSAFPSFFGTDTAAIGGSVQRNKPVLVGERGAELFVPSSSGSIVSNKNLAGAGIGSGGVTVNQTINVTTGVQQTVRSEIVNLMPQIANATKAAVADSRLRGGSFSKAFGG